MSTVVCCVADRQQRQPVVELPLPVNSLVELSVTQEDELRNTCIK